MDTSTEVSDLACNCLNIRVYASDSQLKPVDANQVAPLKTDVQHPFFKEKLVEVAVALSGTVRYVA